MTDANTPEKRCKGHMSAMHRDACPICNPQAPGNLKDMHAIINGGRLKEIRANHERNWIGEKFQTTAEKDRRDLLQMIADSERPPPDGFSSWYDAAVDEKLKRVAAENRLTALQADVDSARVSPEPEDWKRQHHEPRGTFACPVCMNDTPHGHPGLEDQGERRRWIGVDFDGTLAYDAYDRTDPYELGEPIMPMVNRVKDWIARGYEVRILTARMCKISYTAMRSRDLARMEDELRAWCKQHLGVMLKCTNEKDGLMEVLWDDRAVRVIRDTGSPHHETRESFREQSAATIFRAWLKQYGSTDGLSISTRAWLGDETRECKHPNGFMPATEPESNSFEIVDYVCIHCGASKPHPETGERQP